MNYFKMAHIYIFPTVLYPVHKIAMTTSMYTTVVLAFERYYAVSKPISTYVRSTTGTTKRVLKYSGCILLFSIMFNLPKFFEFYVEWCSLGCFNNTQLPIKEYDSNNETMEEFKDRILTYSQINSLASNQDQEYDDNKIQIVAMLHFHWRNFRVHPRYTLYYINIAQNLVTGFIPLILLGILNLGLYLHLLKRRKEVAILTQGNIEMS